MYMTALHQAQVCWSWHKSRRSQGLPVASASDEQLARAHELITRVSGILHSSQLLQTAGAISRQACLNAAALSRTDSALVE